MTREERREAAWERVRTAFMDVLDEQDDPPPVETWAQRQHVPGECACDL